MEGLHGRFAIRKVQVSLAVDDEKLAYAYEKMVKAGITKVCIHKGLLPADYQREWQEPGNMAKSTISAKLPKTGRN